MKSIPDLYLEKMPMGLATLGSVLMLGIGFAATSSPSFFVRSWMKRGVEFEEGKPGFLITVGGIGAAAMSIGITSLVALLGNGDIIEIKQASLVDQMSVAKSIAYGTFAIVCVYLYVWYSGRTNQSWSAKRVGIDSIILACVYVAGYTLLKNPESEEYNLEMAQQVNDFLLPFTFGHYLFPQLLRYTFSVKDLTEGEKILTRYACSFYLASHVLQGSLARGVAPIPAVAFMAVSMVITSVDFQRRLNPRWGFGSVPDGVEIDWTNVVDVRTWSTVAAGVLACLEGDDYLLA